MDINNEVVKNTNIVTDLTCTRNRVAADFWERSCHILNCTVAHGKRPEARQVRGKIPPWISKIT